VYALRGEIAFDRCFTSADDRARSGRLHDCVSSEPDSYMAVVPRANTWTQGQLSLLSSSRGNDQIRWQLSFGTSRVHVHSQLKLVACLLGFLYGNANVCNTRMTLTGHAFFALETNDFLASLAVDKTETVQLIRQLSHWGYGGGGELLCLSSFQVALPSEQVVQYYAEWKYNFRLLSSSVSSSETRRGTKT
jgi:hypothetical protein